MLSDSSTWPSVALGLPRDEYGMAYARAFERVVLRTHKCKFAQFLVFFAAQFDSSFPERFLDLLLRKMATRSKRARGRRQRSDAAASEVVGLQVHRVRQVRPDSFQGALDHVARAGGHGALRLHQR